MILLIHTEYCIGFPSHIRVTESSCFDYCADMFTLQMGKLIQHIILIYRFNTQILLSTHRIQTSEFYGTITPILLVITTVNKQNFTF
jgi:hypothetical protein